MWQAFKTYKQRRARGDQIKPIWQLVILIPVAVVAVGSEKLLGWLEDKFNPVDPDFWKD